MHLQQIFSSTNDNLQMIFSAQGKQEKYYLFGLSWWCLWSSLGDVGDVVVDGGGVSCGFDGVVSVVVVVADVGGSNSAVIVVVVGGRSDGGGGRSDGGDGGGCCAGWGELAVQEGSPGQELGRGEIYELLSVPVAEFPKMD